MAKTEDSSFDGNRKVLIITYYWPPSGGGGVQRWLKFVKYLPMYNYEPIVCIPENAEYPVIDESLLKDIPNNMEIIRSPIWEPYGLFKRFTGKKKDDKVNTGLLFDRKLTFKEKLSLWIRGNLLIPDPRVFWVRPTVKILKKYITDNKIETIITTGPPHSVHLIGLKLRKRLAVNWIMDLRDPWSTLDILDEFSPSKYALSIQRRLELKCLKSATKVITVSPTWAKELSEIAGRDIDTIPNGYDEDDFTNVSANRISDGSIIMTYAGMINSFRNPTNLWETIEKLLVGNQVLRRKFKLRLFGTIDPDVLEEINTYPNLAKCLEHRGYISHDETLIEYSKSDILILLQNDSINAKGHIPGKLFEYLAARRYILAMGNKASDVATILKETGAGKIFDRSLNNEIYNYLSSFAGDQSKEMHMNLESTAYKIYSRRNLTKKLASIMLEINAK